MTRRRSAPASQPPLRAWRASGGHGPTEAAHVTHADPSDDPSRIDDAALVAAIARGDRSALARLYDRYATLLLSLAVRIVGNRAHAEDVLHDALLEAWQGAGEYDESRGTVRAWLVMRVRSRALDEKSRCVRHARILRTHPEPLVSDCYRTPDGRGGDGDRVRQKVADLPPELGAVVSLVYYEGMSASDIGSRLRIPSGTVKSRLARAMTLLRRQLGEGISLLTA